jgi:hypothetical protein
MPAMRRDPEEVLNEFAVALAKTIGVEGWYLNRVRGDRSDRVFLVQKDGSELLILAKLSQSEKGFWGITYPRANEMLKSSIHLLLLTGPSRGYVIRNARLKYYLEKSSHAQAGYRINERDVKQAPYCYSIERIWSELKEAAGR